MDNSNLENLKNAIYKMTRYEMQVCKDENDKIIRCQRENISDEIEDEFTKYIAREINNKNLYFDIARSLTLKFNAKTTKTIDQDIVNKTKSGEVTIKPDLLIYKKKNDKNIILAMVEFKNDLGYTRKIFGDTKKEKISEENYERKYKDMYKNKSKIDEKTGYFYGYKKNYIMKLLNSNKDVEIYSTNKTEAVDKKINFEIEKDCYTYILACSEFNCKIKHIKALYKYDFCRNEKPNYIKFNTFFEESIRLEDKYNKNIKRQEDVKLTLSNDEYGAVNFITDLIEDINSKI